jgi:hypothetical protein
VHSVNDNLTLICTVDTLQIIAYGREIRSVGTITMVYYFIRI